MFYVVTVNNFLWCGLEYLLKPNQVQRITEGTMNAMASAGVLPSDVVLVDIKSHVDPVFTYLMSMDIPPKVILLKSENEVWVDLLFNLYQSILIEGSLQQLRAAILSRRNAWYSTSRKSILSAREKAIFQLSVEGSSVNEIAVILGVNAKTVYSQRTNLCRKLGVMKVGDLIPYKDLLSHYACGE